MGPGEGAGWEIEQRFGVRASVCTILENARESRPNEHAKPAEPAGRLAPRTKKRSHVGARSDVDLYERGNRYSEACAGRRARTRARARAQQAASLARPPIEATAPFSELERSP